MASAPRESRDIHACGMAYAGSHEGTGRVWRRYGVCKTFANRPKSASESQLEPFSPIRFMFCEGQRKWANMP